MGIKPIAITNPRETDYALPRYDYKFIINKIKEDSFPYKLFSHLEFKNSDKEIKDVFVDAVNIFTLLIGYKEIDGVDNVEFYISMNGNFPKKYDFPFLQNLYSFNIDLKNNIRFDILIVGIKDNKRFILKNGLLSFYVILEKQEKLDFLLNYRRVRIPETITAFDSLDKKIHKNYLFSSLKIIPIKYKNKLYLEWEDIKEFHPDYYKILLQYKNDKFYKEFIVKGNSALLENISFIPFYLYIIPVKDGKVYYNGYNIVDVSIENKALKSIQEYYRALPEAYLEQDNIIKEFLDIEAKISYDIDNPDVFISDILRETKNLGINDELYFETLNASFYKKIEQFRGTKNDLTYLFKVYHSLIKILEYSDNEYLQKEGYEKLKQCEIGLLVDLNINLINNIFFYLDKDFDENILKIIKQRLLICVELAWILFTFRHQDEYFFEWFDDILNEINIIENQKEKYPFKCRYNIVADYEFRADLGDIDLDGIIDNPDRTLRADSYYHNELLRADREQKYYADDNKIADALRGCLDEKYNLIEKQNNCDNFYLFADKSCLKADNNLISDFKQIDKFEDIKVIDIESFKDTKEFIEKDNYNYNIEIQKEKSLYAKPHFKADYKIFLYADKHLKADNNLKVKENDILRADTKIDYIIGNELKIIFDKHKEIPISDVGGYFAKDKIDDNVILKEKSDYYHQRIGNDLHSDRKLKSDLWYKEKDKFKNNLYLSKIIDYRKFNENDNNFIYSKLKEKDTIQSVMYENEYYADSGLFSDSYIGYKTDEVNFKADNNFKTDLEKLRADSKGIFKDNVNIENQIINKEKLFELKYPIQADKGIHSDNDIWIGEIRSEFININTKDTYKEKILDNTLIYEKQTFRDVFKNDIKYNYKSDNEIKSDTNLLSDRGLKTDNLVADSDLKADNLNGVFSDNINIMNSIYQKSHFNKIFADTKRFADDEIYSDSTQSIQDNFIIREIS